MGSKAGCDDALCCLKTGLLLETGPWQHLWGGLEGLACPAPRRKVGGGFM